MSRKKALGSVGVETIGEVEEETTVETVQVETPVATIVEPVKETKETFVGRKVGGKEIVLSERLSNGKIKLVDKDAVTFIVNDAFIEEYLK
jgi:hypothetical protein